MKSFKQILTYKKTNIYNNALIKYKTMKLKKIAKTLN